MARRGDALYLRGKTWYLDCNINGTRHQKRLGKGITRSVALELAQVQRGAILKGELGIGKKVRDLSFATPGRSSRRGPQPARNQVPRRPTRNACAGWRNRSAGNA